MRKRTRTHIKHRFRSILWWAALPAAIVALRLAWGWEAHHRLAGMQAALRAQGIPVTPEDLPDPAQIPPEQDAVPALRRAQADLHLSGGDLQLIEMDIGRVEFTAQEVANLRRIWQEQQQVIADLDESAARPMCGWPRDFDAYYAPNGRFALGDYRMMAQLLAQRAIIGAQDQHGTDAMRNLRRIVNVARIVERSPMYMAALDGSAIRTMCLQMIERLDPDLDWSDPVVIDQARQLLADFQAAQQRDFFHAFVPEFAFNHYWIGRNSGEENWWIAPLLEDEEARVLRRYADDLPALRAASYPEFMSRLVVAPPPGDSTLMTILGIFSSDTGVAPYYGLAYYERAADVNAAVLLLAARLYRHDHGGYPLAAADVTPAYLPAVPRDPFDPAGKPMRYRLDPDGPTVWSVGKNGTDEGAPPMPPTGSGYRYSLADMVYGAAWRNYLKALPLP